jgi:chaperonin cofactor prefoldin
MSIRSAATFFMFALMGSSASPLAAQAPEVPPQVQQWLAEMQQIQAQLEPVHEEAMQDTALQRRYDEVNAAVLAAMVAADPETEARLERVQQIMAEAAAAQQAGDTDRIAVLAPEAQEIQARLQATQQAAMEQPPVSEQLTAYRTALHARMTAIDPEAGPLLRRIEELDAQIRQALGGG